MKPSSSATSAEDRKPVAEAAIQAVEVLPAAEQFVSNTAVKAS